MNTQTETAVTEKPISVDELKKRKPLKPGKISWKKDFKRNWVVYVIFIPVFLYMIFVHYLPMFGIIMSFQNFL